MTLTRSPGTYRETDNSGALPRDLRQMLAGMVTGAGVLPGSASPLVQGTASFAYQINAGWWATTYGGTDGLHVWGNDGSYTISVDDTGASLAAPGAGTTRIDIIYAMQPSNSENAATDSIPVVAVKKGTAGTPGLAPTIPTGALELARNEMTSAATSTASAGNTITQTSARAGLKGLRDGAILTLSRSISSGLTTNLLPAASLTVGTAGYVRTSTGIYLPKDGLYTMTCQGSASPVTSARQFLQMVVTNPPTGSSSTSFRMLLTGDDSGATSVTVPLVAGTVVNVQGYQATGVDKTMSAVLTVVRESLPTGW